ncbi:MAG: thermostable hemolysin [Pseudomonadales bacterium]
MFEQKSEQPDGLESEPTKGIPGQAASELWGFAPVAARGAFHLMEAAGADAHAQLQQFIGEQFRTHFAAEVPDDTPRLLGAFGPDGDVLAVFGIRTRADGFFSEHYLGMGLETALLNRTGERFDGSRVVEVSHFAIAGRRAFAGIVPLMAEGLSRLGFEHVVCTATRCLVRYFSRRYLTPLILTEARAADLPEDQRARWGSYYLADPAVAFGPLAPALAREPRH